MAARGDRGFTLPELLITIVILGVIAVPLANVVISYFLNSSTTSARLNESHDEQIAAAYWQQDVSSVGIRGDYDLDKKTFPLQSSVDTTLPCALPAGTVVVTLAWNEYDPAHADSPTVVGSAYLHQGTTMIRVHCTGSAVDSTETLAHNVTGSPTTSSTGSGPVPTSITLTFNVADPSGTGQPYTVTLNGQRRQT